MNEQTLLQQRQQSQPPPPPQPSPRQQQQQQLPTPQPSRLPLPSSSTPKSMPVPTSQPPSTASAPSSPSPPPSLPPPTAASAPEAGSSCSPTPVPTPSSSSPLPTCDPSSAGPSATNPNLPPTTAATSSESTVPKKIPFRPRKTRKLAASSSPAATEGDDKGETGAASPDGNNGAIVVAGVAAAPVAAVAANNHARAVYRAPPRPLSAEGEVAAAIRHLRAADPQLTRVLDTHEPPVFQSLHPPFHALTRSILYQQLAFKAAASIYSRFLALCGGEDGVVPEVVLGLTPHQLRQIGVSARKASYLHDLANKYRNGILSDASIVAMDDKSLFTMLNMVKGIGAWSVHMFMIFSLHRPDVLPVGDVGVRKGVQLLYGLDALPRPSQMEQLCERWKPYRSVGSWYMWRLVEAKGTPAALAMVSSGGGAVAAADGGGIGGGASLVIGMPPALTPPLPPPHLHRQIPQQHHAQHQHLQQHQHLHPAQHPHPQQQQQRQHQLQMQPQLIDAIQSIPNLG